MKQPTFLIVGQGITGTLVAWHLWKKGIEFKVVDDGAPLAASRIAGGVINPITGRHYKISWQFDLFLPKAITTYLDMEEKLGGKYWHPMPIYRFFGNYREQNDWMAKPLSNYAVPLDSTDRSLEYLNAPYQGIQIRQGGFVDVRSLLNDFRKWLDARGLLFDQKLDMNHLEIEDNQLFPSKYPCDQIIWCQGSAGMDNPYFDSVPFAPNRGEWLIIECPSLPSNQILSKHMLVVPEGEKLFRVTGIYDWYHPSAQPTAEGKAVLVDQLNKLIRVPFKVTEHGAAIRPAVSDRKPVLGQSASLSNAWIINGMGSKGLLMAPMLSEMLTQHIVDGKVIWPEVAVERFYSKGSS